SSDGPKPFPRVPLREYLAAVPVGYYPRRRHPRERTFYAAEPALARSWSQPGVRGWPSVGPHSVYHRLFGSRPAFPAGNPRVLHNFHLGRIAAQIRPEGQAEVDRSRDLYPVVARPGP